MTWHIDGCSLQVCDNVEYLGGFIGNKYNDVHVDAQLKSFRKAFYTLQSAGLCSKRLDWETEIYLFNTCCRSILTYACYAVYLSKAYIADLDECQSKLIKGIVGLNPRHRSTQASSF